MLTRRHFLFATAASSVYLKADAADPQIRDVRTIAVMPKSVSEIKDFHDRARGYAAELLPENEPFETKNFAPYLTKQDEIDSEKRRPNTCARRHVISIGLEMLNDDQKQLPLLSREQILAYLKAHFVSVQARIYREPVTRSLYLGSRCLAATRAFQGGALTKPFTPTVAESVNNMRSLGLLLPPRTAPTPANLRTLVLVHRNQLSQEGNNHLAAAKTNYELLFIRAREVNPDRLELHAFATSDDRTKFHWLKPAEAPAIPSDCSIRGAVHFTEYSHQGLYPKSAVIRRSMIIGKKTFSWEALEQFSRKKFGQTAMDCITPLLDAIISSEIK